MNVDYFVELDAQTNPQSADEFTVRYHSLIAGGKKKEADALRNQWSKNASKVSLAKPNGELWQMIAAPAVDLTPLPHASWFLQFTFALAKPYISKDDNPFYVIDNPIVRDKVFQLPMVRSTSWKGNLYSALWQLGRDKQDDKQMQRLFGNIRGEESGQVGRLYFYPTFFTQTSLEIINSHDRKRRVGKNPILFECVPAGAQGVFSLLYVPLDLIGHAEAEIREQAVADLRLAAEAIRAMLLTYGFSAKRSSGYGVARETVEAGMVQMRSEEAAAVQSAVPAEATPAPALPKYLAAPGRLKAAYLTPDGVFRERSQAELANLTKTQRQEYDKAKKWWEREGQALAQAPPPEPQPEAVPLAPTWFRREFKTFAELLEKVGEAEKTLLPTGGAA